MNDHSTLPADFDEAPLAEIEKAVPPDEFKSFIAEYLRNAEERIALVETIAKGGDLATLAGEAHKLISTSGSFGVMRASFLARELEAVCKAGRSDESRSIVSQISESSRRAWGTMRARFLPNAA
jgi:HPt (histidine-containing phosphotransfer) domain-containing protein